MFRTSAVLVAVACVLCAGAARAQSPPSARLAYTRGPGAGDCPDEAALRDAVSTRLGYVPFSPDAPLEVAVAIERTPRGLRGRVATRDTAGRRGTAREIDAASNACGELVSALALAISIAIDPLGLAQPPATHDQPPPPPPPPPPPAPLPAPPNAPAPPSAAAAPRPAPRVAVPGSRPARAAAREPWTLAIALGAGLFAGSSPAVAVGPSARVELGWRALVVGVEGRVELPTSVAVPGGGAVTAALTLGALLPCARVPLGQRVAVLACVVVAAGALQGSASDVSRATPRASFYAAAGARLAADVVLAGPLFVWAAAELLATLTPTALTIEDRANARDVVAWTTSPVAGGGAAGLGVRFR